MNDEEDSEIIQLSIMVSVNDLKSLYISLSLSGPLFSSFFPHPPPPLHSPSPPPPIYLLFPFTASHLGSIDVIWT